MKIEHIKKSGKNQYEITLEKNQKIKTYDTVMLKYQIALKKELSEELLQKIKEETKKAQVLEKILQYMNRKLRSEKEVRTYIQKFDIDNEEEIICFLRNQGFFNIDSYIEAYIHDRFVFSNDGPNKIVSDLLDQDFDLNKIEEHLSKLEESKIMAKLSKIIEKKINSSHKYSEEYCKQKITEQMLHLGYLKPMIQDILETKQLDHTNSLKQEAYKLYQKYLGKKNGSELLFLLKQKLYQKRYPIEEINDVLEQIISEN